MKKVCAAAFLSFLLLLAFGCSSTPSGTESIRDINKNIGDRIGKEVVVVGIAETKTNVSHLRMFKLYNDSEFLWVTVPEGADEPPQGYNVRVTGLVQQKEFDLIGKAYYIEATKIRME